MMPICKRLSSDEWFAPKCSAATIIPATHANISDSAERAALRAMFLQISKDETPMVRKYAYDHIGELCVDAGVAIIRTELSEVLKCLLEETQENIRMIMVDVAVKMSEACKNTPDDFKEIAYPLVEHIGSEQSWRVRKNFGRSIGDIAAFMPKDFAGQMLVPFYVDLLKDTEGEVRLAAVKSMTNLAKNIDPKSFVTIAEALDGIMNDTISSTKIALSEIILEVASAVGGAVASKSLVPFIVRLLESDVADMRSNVLEKLNLLAQSIGVEEVISQFLPKLLPMSKDQKWRVRKLVLENTTNFAKTVGPDVFDSTFRPILFEGLNDAIFGVREVASRQFAVLVQTFGFEWASAKLLPEALAFNVKAKNYHHRSVSLQVVYELAFHPVELPQSYVGNVLIPIAVNFSRDPVVNIRSFSIKTLATLAKKADAGAVDSAIKPALMTLTQDSDGDVKLSAARALKNL
jgi:serine/threonine-protein phosphatase 2A regulatory subunit A